MADGVVNAWWDGDAVFVAERVGEVVQLKSHAAEHSCFVRHADLSRQLLKQLRDSGYVTRLSQEGEYVRICWLDRGAVARGCEWLEQEAKVKTFEGGISPVRRWCVDHEVWPVKPRACYLDIENDSDVPFAEKERARIFCVGVEDAETGVQRIFTLSDDDDAAERKMLAQLCEYLGGYDQVAIWNGDRFDVPAIKGRLKGLRMFDQLRELKRILFVDYMVIFKRMHVAESGDEKASMSLDNVCREVLGIGKVDFDASKTREAFDAGGTRRAEMFKYCLHDVHLMAMLEKRKGYLALHWSICEAMGVFPDTRGARPAGQVESFMLRMGREEGHKFPTRIAHEDAVDREEDQFRGAHVMAPPDKAGILKGVHVVDFSSLYPTIIITFNMSPETIREKPELADPNFGRPAYLPKIPLTQVVLERPPECCEAPITGHWFDTTTIGLLPRAVQRLLDLRKKWSAKMASLPPGTPEWFDAYLRSQAYKVAANACFGVAGNKHSLIYDVRVAESIAQGGVWLIKHTLDAARKRGWNPLYADTDSGFIAGVSNEEFAAFRDWCNAELFPPLVAAQGCRVNRISIAYEKKFRRLVFSGKKRYCTPPESPIWMADGSFKPIGRIRVGDKVWGWKDGSRTTGPKKKVPKKAERRQLVVSEVVAVHRHRASIVKLTLESGTVIRCTPDHRWRFQHRSGTYSDYVTPKVGRILSRVIEQPRLLDSDEQREADWLGGIWDGEGSLAGPLRGQIVISQSRLKNPEVCARIETALALLGFSWRSEADKTCERFVLRGGLQATLNFLTWCRPAKGAKLAASIPRSRFSTGDKIVEVVPDGSGDVVGLTTTTGNYVVWGFASKNCGAYEHYKGEAATAESKPEVKGLEYKRGDSTKTCRQMQRELIELMMVKDCDDVAEYVALVERWRGHILNDKLERDEFVLSQSLSRSLKDYARNTKKDGTLSEGSAHLAVARVLEKRGRDVGIGTRIDYVVTDASESPMKAIPLEDFKGDFDRHYLWESRVWPATERVLEHAFPAHDWSAYDKTRPPKPRGKGSRNLRPEGQVELGGLLGALRK